MRLADRPFGTLTQAKRFLAKALGGANHPAPRVINTDGHARPLSQLSFAFKSFSSRGRFSSG